MSNIFYDEPEHEHDLDDEATEEIPEWFATGEHPEHPEVAGQPAPQ